MIINPVQTLHPTNLTDAKNAKRIEIIDALRGFSLFGIILIHSTQFFEQTLLEPIPESFNINYLTKRTVQLFAQNKFYSIFSFLFGLSFAIQIKNASAKEQAFFGRFIWRMFILLVIGYFHSLLYPDEILQGYALLGLVLLVFAKSNNRKLLLLSLIFFIASIAMELYRYDKEVFGAIDSFTIAAENSTFSRFMGLHRLSYSILTGRLFVTMALFFLGVYAGRKNVFINTSNNQLLFKKLLISSAIVAILCFAIKFLIASNPNTSIGLFGQSLELTYVTTTATSLRRIAMSFFYVAVLVKLNRVSVFQPVLQWLVPVGRMGLSIYIMQSVILTAFFSLEPAIISSLGMTVIVGITIILFFVQVLFAYYWMLYFRFGPVEWLWRILVNRKVEPILKHKHLVKEVRR